MSDQKNGAMHVMPVFGTRPEAVKMAPIIRTLKAREQDFRLTVTVTAQHRSMLDQILDVFAITPDYDLNIMQEGQTLADVTVRALAGLEPLLTTTRPDVVLVQGDTTTVFAAALAAFYHQIPVGHVEAGLRTYQRYNPFPEEMNRMLTSDLASIHFAPTAASRQNLLRENVDPETVYVTGNTVIDALLSVAETVPAQRHEGRTILVTAHRRENLGAPMQQICRALLRIVNAYPDVKVVFPVHKNPKVRETVFGLLSGHPRIDLQEPPDYAGFVPLMKQADIVVTDSGGVQEEAPSLGKPVLVLRNTTERPEGVDAGTARLVGTEENAVVAAIAALLDAPDAYAAMANAVNPYGDGRASTRIADALLHYFGRRADHPQDFVP